MKLYYFTFCYPFGNGEQWKANELNVLVRHFEEITVIPFFYGGNFDKPKPLPVGVKLSGPFLTKLDSGKKSDLFHIIFNKRFPYLSRNFFQDAFTNTKSYNLDGL